MAAPAGTRQILKERLALMRQQVESLEHDIERAASERPEPSAAANGAASRLGGLRDGLRQLLRSPSAPTTLNLLLSLAVKHGARAILFIMRQGSLWAWSGLNTRGERLPLAKFALSPEESPLLASALRSQQTQRAGASEPWEGRLGALSEAGAAAIPLAVERSGGILWLDPGPEAEDGAIEAVECLVAAASGALEILAHKRSPGLTTGARMTADDRALAAQLPYALSEEGAQAAPVPGLPLGAEAAMPPVPGADLGRQHEDARRLARLLVSEIKLYNEDKVVLGRKAGDLYQRLREDIERSRLVYTERVSAEVRAATDYFQQELVAMLADGNAALLGSDPSGAS